MSKKRNQESSEPENLEAADTTPVEPAPPSTTERASVSKDRVSDPSGSSTSPTERAKMPLPEKPGAADPDHKPMDRDPSSLMTLRVFATLAGPKWDQMAGFVAWAQTKKLQPMTMEQWRVEFQSFKNRPVG